MTLSNVNTVALFFVYGLAFFAMGLAVALEARRSRSRLALSLRFLAAFGLLHGAAQWVVMFLLVDTGGASVEGSFAIPQVRGLYTSISETRLPATEQCIGCHWDAAASYVVAGTDWITSAGVWSRYLLFLPGSVLAAGGVAAP